MGSKFEKFSIGFFMFFVVFSGIVIANAWGSEITIFNRYEFEIDDNTVVINGTIEEINKPNDDNFYIKISGKSYNIEDYFSCPTSWMGGSNNEDKELFYYTIEIGDNITIYKSCKIVLNGEVYQNSVFIEYSWFAWVITFIPVVIVVILLLICLALVGFEKEELEEHLEDVKKTLRMVNKDLKEEREKYKKLLIPNEIKIGASVFRQLYCNNCGSRVEIEVGLNKGHCGYCGTEVRL